MKSKHAKDFLDVQGLNYKYREDGGVGAVKVEGCDLLDTLAGSAWGDDKIIDYYLMKLRDQYIARKAAKLKDIKIRFFNAFFFTKLMEGTKNSGLPSTKV